MCSNDNKTFDSSCHFFATKCTLEGTKKGHKLHLDYIGPCKCESPRAPPSLPSQERGAKLALLLALPPLGCVILGTSLPLSELQGSQL